MRFHACNFEVGEETCKEAQNRTGSELQKTKKITKRRWEGDESALTSRRIQLRMGQSFERKSKSSMKKFIRKSVDDESKFVAAAAAATTVRLLKLEFAA